jgi:hypothetical protein
MGMGLSVYLVPERDVATVVGCKDESLLADILAHMAEGIEWLDRDCDTGDEEFSPGLTFNQAMHELFAGAFSKPEQCAFMYVYAFEIVCHYYGEFLNNSYFCPLHHWWFGRLDEMLANGGVSLRFHDLLERPPVVLPDARKYVHLGHWRGEETAAALPRPEALLPSLTGDELKGLASVREWLVKAVDQPDAIIVGVFC